MDGSDAKGFALIRPPGHHAGRENPMGFCIFNNVAVAARYCQERHHLKKVAAASKDPCTLWRGASSFDTVHKRAMVGMHSRRNFVRSMSKRHYPHSCKTGLR